MNTSCFWYTCTLIVAAQMTIFCTTGCALFKLFKPSDPDDLQFVSVIVEPAQAANQTADRTDSGLSNDNLTITFSSRVNLMQFMSGNYDFRYHDVAPCADWHEGRLTHASRFKTDPDIYWRDTPIEARAKAGILPESDSELYYYRVRVAADNRPFPKLTGNYYGKGAPRLSYDLRAEPQDICLIIYGSQYFGPSFETNIVKIPRDAIVKAFQSAQQSRIGDAENR